MWTLFYEKLNIAIMNLVFGGKEAPLVEWSGFARRRAYRPSGRGIAGPKAIVAVTEFTFRLWARGEREKYFPLPINLPATMQPEVFTAGKVLQLVALQNKLPDKYLRH